MGILRRDGSARVRVIAPGLGSSGYYPAAVLERDAAVFDGVQVYWDHPTRTEESDRPERSLRDLAGKVVDGSVKYEAAHVSGPGIYADVQFFKPYQESVEELAPFIGMSIRATGKAAMGDVEGKRVPVIESLVSARSVDVVTAAGAGGQILSLFESARNRVATQPHSGGDSGMDETKLKEAEAARETALAEAKAATEKVALLETENARLREGQLLTDARTFVDATLPADLPELTRARLLESMSAKPVIADGALDEDAYKTVIEAAVKDEVEYLAKITESGKVRDLGRKPADGADTKAALIESFKRAGLSAEEAAIAAEGR